MIEKVLITLALLTALCASSQANHLPREKLLMDAGWKFQLGEPVDAGKLFDYPEPDLSKQKPDSEAKANDLAVKRPDPVKTNLGGGVSWVQPGFDDSQWRAVSLPHDWVLELPFSPKADKGHGFHAIGTNFPQNSVGWYRRVFEIPAVDKGRTVWIEFGGVYRNALVWLNGHCLGRMASGYTSFYFDVTDRLNFGGANTLVVRVDATKEEGWFYEGAGIYRHVWLIKTQPVHVAHWGTFVTSKVTGKKAALGIETTVENSSSQPAKAELISTIEDDGGKKIASENTTIEVPAGGHMDLNQSALVRHPKLWSPETPKLYLLVTRIKIAGQLADEYRTPFGIRTVEFRPDGFYLNGRHRFIKGACNHQDFAGVGVAVPDRLEADRVAMLKAVGCDGWRTSHNPVGEVLLDECDRQGVMVMDETRRFGSYREPMDDLKAMILRDRNHPSVVIWSLGNEEMDVQGNAAGADACKAMQDLAHRLDPSRSCTLAINHQFDNEGFTTVLDVTGMNYLKLWNSMDKYHQQNPERSYVTSEEASTRATRGLYFVDKPKGYLTAYDSNVPGWGSTAEDWWNFYQTRPWVAGAFIWTGFDYRGEPSPYAWPCVNSHYGAMMDTCGFPKDNYYFYQAWWTTNTVLHLYPHWNWNQVSHRQVKVSLKTSLPRAEVLCDGASYGEQKSTGGPMQWMIYDDGEVTNVTVVLREVASETDASGKLKDKITDAATQVVTVTENETTTIIPVAAAGENAVTISKEDAPINIWVQSNCEAVELSVNGVSQGRKKIIPLHHVEWTVPYAPGFISATGYKNGKAVKTERIETTGPGAALRLTANRSSLNADGEDVALLKVEALDAQGRFVPTASPLVHFAVSGVRLLGVGNGDPSCHESDLGPERSLFNGLALGIVQAPRTPGTIIIKVSAPGMKPAEIALPAMPAAARPAVPEIPFTCKNPVIPGFYPDPSVCRVGEDFYLVNSSFEYFPGVPIWHSRDLVHWRQIGHVLKRRSQLELAGVNCSDGIYAPTIRFHNGTFYMVATWVSAGVYKNFYVTATNPASAWSDPVWYDQSGIDPSLFFDDDGKVYFQSNRGLTFNMERAIYQSEIDIKSGKRLTGPKMLWRGSGGSYVEGPHIYKRDSWYYLLTAEGGTSYGHMVAIARSKNVWGPYESCPQNPILSNRYAYEQIHGTGHADLVQAADDSWWMVHLAFRKTVGDIHTLGRETCLAPVKWRDGWPVVNRSGINSETIAKTLPSQPWPQSSTRDDFDGNELGLQWIHLRNPVAENYSLTERKGFLRLRGSEKTLFDIASPTFVARRQQHFDFNATTSLEFDPQGENEAAGLALLMTNEHHYDFFVTQRGGRRVLLVKYNLELIRQTAAEIPLAPGPVQLCITGTRELYHFSFSQNGAPLREIAKVNTRYLGTEVTSGYNGVVIGLYATGNGRPCVVPADFDWFEYVPAKL